MQLLPPKFPLQDDPGSTAIEATSAGWRPRNENTISSGSFGEGELSQYVFALPSIRFVAGLLSISDVALSMRPPKSSDARSIADGSGTAAGWGAAAAFGAGAAPGGVVPGIAGTVSSAGSDSVGAGDPAAGVVTPAAAAPVGGAAAAPADGAVTDEEDPVD